eukprot:TRINITY_DN28077_c0_g2_i4.p1 TRINITY_DN28077_c0_g2~~TRINITY_DN28077_c0_g2_i4.p1  ORF type:complete len:548 (-),score=51.56 TRINITY_DN28077_c0_g2_i4:223-1866(-)
MFTLHYFNFLQQGYKFQVSQPSSYKYLPVKRQLYSKIIRNMEYVQTAQQKQFLPLQLLVATDDKGGIGKAGKLPWSLPQDLKYFKDLTSQTRSRDKFNAVIMGRKTWESIPSKFRPFKDRINIVLSRQGIKLDDNNGESIGGSSCRQFSDIKDALEWISAEQQHIENVFVIGGGEIYRQALTEPDIVQHVQAIHLTRVEGDYNCDTFLCDINVGLFRVWATTPPRISRKEGQLEGIRYSYMIYTQNSTINNFLLPAASIPKHEENQYLEMIKEIMINGEFKGDRTGTGTLAVFGRQMRFNLRHTFPLLTSKRVFWRGVVEELLWFIRGCTDSKDLAKVNVHIWDDNGSRQFLDSNGFKHREEGDLGPVYGFQWRHFGAEYYDAKTNYGGKGIDQLKMVIDQIKNNPDSRRIILSAWNPAATQHMALPPCHMMCQFYVNNGELSCQMYQRSCDMGLGVPFNIASYALLTHIIAHICSLEVGDFVHTLGDAHVYTTHLEALHKQLQNQPRHFPVLEIKRRVTDIEDFKFDDFELIGYKPNAKISMAMAV